MLITKIKAVRIQLSAILNLIKLLGTSREVSLAITNLQKSRMFLGQILKEISPETNPYPDADNPGSLYVELPADVVDNNPLLTLRVNSQVKNIKTVRLLIEEEITKIKALRNDEYIILLNSLKGNNHIEAAESFIFAQFSLIEAKMWLGMELQSAASYQAFEDSQKKNMDMCCDSTNASIDTGEKVTRAGINHPGSLRKH